MTIAADTDLKKINQILDSGGVSQLHIDAIKDEVHLEKAEQKLRRRAKSIRRRMKLDSNHTIRAERQQKINAIYEALEILAG